MLPYIAAPWILWVMMLLIHVISIRNTRLWIFHHDLPRPGLGSSSVTSTSPRRSPWINLPLGRDLQSQSFFLGKQWGISPGRIVILWDLTRENGDLPRENRDLTREHGDLILRISWDITVMFGHVWVILLTYFGVELSISMCNKMGIFHGSQQPTYEM